MPLPRTVQVITESWTLCDGNGLAARKHVTRRILWEEYRALDPQGYAYSRYCELFAAWRASQDPSMRVLHVAGERPMFLAFAQYHELAVQRVKPN